jgi:plasmid stabilization system protein ParE
MAEIIWTHPAVEDVERIVGYFEVDNPDAAQALRRRIVRHVDQLGDHPLSGPIIPEMLRQSRLYRQIVEPPCRVFYRVDREAVIILNVIRGEMQFRAKTLSARYREFKRPTASEDLQ